MGCSMEARTVSGDAASVLLCLIIGDCVVAAASLTVSLMVRGGNG